jgi:hypothetical protein
LIDGVRTVAFSIEVNIDLHSAMDRNP